MAITAVNRFSGNATGASTTQSTSSISWTSGRGYLAFVHSVDSSLGGGSLTSLSSVAGITWTLLQSVTLNQVTYTVYSGIATSTTSAALVANSNVSTMEVYVILDEFSGVATTGTFVQSNMTTYTSSTSPVSTTLSAFGNASNATWVGAAASRPNSQTSFGTSSGYTSLQASTNTTVATGSGQSGASAYIASNDTAPSMTWGGTFFQRVFVFGVEIKAGASGGPKTFIATVASTEAVSSAVVRARTIGPTLTYAEAVTASLSILRLKTLTASIDQVTDQYAAASLKLKFGATQSESETINAAVFLASELHQSTSFTLPGTGATSGGTAAWTNPGNILAADNAYATQTASGTVTDNGYLQATNFGFSIPAGSLIFGIEAQIERSRSGGTVGEIRDNTVQLLLAGSPAGSNYAVAATNWPTTDALATYGSSTDKWGNTLTLADINNANFGIQLRVTSTTNSTGASNTATSVNQNSTSDFTGGTTNASRTWSTLTASAISAQSDGQSTSITLPGTNSNVASTYNYIGLGGFGYTIPTTATINAIQVTVQGTASASLSVFPETVQLLKDLAPVGTNKGTTSGYFATSLTTFTFGNTTTDLWGTTWTPDEINNSLGVIFRPSGRLSSSTGTLSIDQISVRVTWTPAGGDRTARVDAITLKVHYGPDFTQKVMAATYGENETISSSVKLFRKMSPAAVTETEAVTSVVKRARTTGAITIGQSDSIAPIVLTYTRYLVAAYGQSEAITAVATRSRTTSTAISESSACTSALKRLRSIGATNSQTESITAVMAIVQFLSAAISAVEGVSASLARSLHLTTLIAEVESLAAAVKRDSKLVLTIAESEQLTSVVKRVRNIVATNSEVAVLAGALARNRPFVSSFSESEAITNTAFNVGRMRLLAAAIIETLNVDASGIQRIRSVVGIIPETEAFLVAVQRARNLATVVVENGLATAKLSRFRDVVSNMIEAQGVTAGSIRRIREMASDIAEAAGCTVRVSIYAKNPTTIRLNVTFEHWVQAADGSMELQTATDVWESSTLAATQLVSIVADQTITIDVDPSYTN